MAKSPKKPKSLKVPKAKPVKPENMLPENGRLLLTGSGKDFIEKIGVEAARELVLGVLVGQNIRAQTEPITRQRVALISNAMIALFTEGWAKNPNFTEELSSLAVKQITTAKSNDSATIWPAQWLIGLTGKSAQNVIRKEEEARELYLKNFESAVKEAAEKSLSDFGTTKLSFGWVKDGNNQVKELDWLDLTRLATAIGCATMTIRGSDKSTFGKLFERLVLGAVLTIMGFEFVESPKNPKTDKVFWLSDSSGSRECDATIRFKAGKIIRIDMGFIGEGNPEISKDKLSRYANEIREGDTIILSRTFIIIDKMPKTTKTLTEAQKSGAEIIQMSMKFWPTELASKLHEHLGFEPEILTIDEGELTGYLSDKIAPIKIQNFLTGVLMEEVDVTSEQPEAANQIPDGVDDDE